MISIVIPAYNEEKRIYGSLVKLTNFMNKNFTRYEIICVVDGEDKTGEIVKSFIKRNPRVKILEFKRRLGKGNAIQKGILASEGEKIIVLDADLPISLELVPRYLEVLEDYDLVTGKRLFIYPFHRKIARRIWILIYHALFPELKVSDTQAGFKGFRRKVALTLFKNLKTYGYGWDVEILLKASKKGFSIKEYPIRFFYKKNSKINFFIDWFFMLVELVKLKFMSRRNF